MPDLITHMVFGHLMIRSYELIKNKVNYGPFRCIFYIGTVLPDVFTRPLYILFPFTHDWTIAMHTPLGAIVLCGILSLLFTPSLRKHAFVLMAAGSLGHFILDALQRQIIYNNYWFFPFSWKTVGWGLAGAGTILEWVPVWLLIVICFECIVWIVQKHNSSSDS